MRGIQVLERLGGGDRPVVDLIGSVIHGTAIAEWKLDSDGKTYGNSGSGMTFLNNWITPQIGMSSYEIKATFLSGIVPNSGTLGTWESAGSDRTWTLTDEGSCAMRMDIRLASTGAIVDTANVTLNVGGTGGGGGGGGGGGFNPPPNQEEE